MICLQPWGSDMAQFVQDQKISFVRRSYGISHANRLFCLNIAKRLFAKI